MYLLMSCLRPINPKFVLSFFVCSEVVYKIDLFTFSFDDHVRSVNGLIFSCATSGNLRSCRSEQQCLPKRHHSGLVRTVSLWSKFRMPTRMWNLEQAIRELHLSQHCLFPLFAVDSSLNISTAGLRYSFQACTIRVEIPRDKATSSALWHQCQLAITRTAQTRGKAWWCFCCRYFEPFSEETFQVQAEWNLPLVLPSSLFVGE